jgi:hypothetical protein
MKLPIILSAMIAALAIPGSLAGDAMADKTTETAAPQAMEGPEAMKEGSEAMKEAPKAKGKMKKASGGHHAKGHHHKMHAHQDGGANSSTDPYKGEYDEKLRAADGDVNKDLSPKAGVEEAPGQKTP